MPAADKRHPISAADRGLIQLYYTPASRDAAAQVRATAGALAARLLRAIEWALSSALPGALALHDGPPQVGERKYCIGLYLEHI